MILIVVRSKIILTNAAGGYLPWVVGPAFLANTESFGSFDFAARVLAAVHFQAGI